MGQELIRLCELAEAQFKEQRVSSQLLRHRSQISSIKDKAIEIVGSTRSPPFLREDSSRSDQISTEEASKQLVRVILEKEVTSRELRISPK